MPQENRRARILIVEDEVVIAEDLRIRTERLGHVICGIARTGPEAIAMAEADRPDLIFMDIVLEGSMDGIEAATRIRSLYNIPVIFISAWADEERLRRAQQSQPFGFVLKPFTDRDLRVSTAMALYAAEMDMDRIRTEERYRQSERRYRRLFDESVTGIFQTTPDGRIIRINQAFARMFGYGSPEELIATVDDIANHLYAEPNRRAYVVQLAAEQDTPVRIRNLFRRRDGQPFSSILHLWMVRDAAGGPEYLEGFVEDMTKMDRFESTLQNQGHFIQSVLEAVPSPVLHLDRQDKCANCNQAFLDMLGRLKGDVLGRHVSGFAPAELEQALAEEPHEFAVSLPDGRRQEYILHRSTLRNQRSEGAGTLAILQDVGALHGAEARLKQLQRENARLTGELHYRVRSTLQTVTSLLQIRAHHLTDPQARAALDHGRQHVGILAALFDLLDASAGKEAVSLDACLKRVAQVIWSTSRPREAAAMIQITADDIHLQRNQVVPFGLASSEILDNSLRHAAVSNKETEIRVVAAPAEGGGFTCTFTDTGPGIPAHICPGHPFAPGLTLAARLAEEQLSGSFVIRYGQGAHVIVTVAGTSGGTAV